MGRNIVSYSKWGSTKFTGLPSFTWAYHSLGQITHIATNTTAITHWSYPKSISRMLYIPQNAWIFTRLTRYQSGNHFLMSGGDLLSLHTQPHKLGIFPQFTSSIPHVSLAIFPMFVNLCFLKPKSCCWIYVNLCFSQGNITKYHEISWHINMFGLFGFRIPHSFHIFSRFECPWVMHKYR